MWSFGYVVVAGLLLVGCGGRAGGNQPGEVDLPEGGRAAAAGGTAGSASTAGGASGAAGAGTVQVIDDEEPRDGRPSGVSSAAFFWGSPTAGSHLGNWFVTSDTTKDVELSPFMPARDGSSQARHASGATSESGVVLWAELIHPQHASVDLSDYVGITFWARLESKTGVLAVALEDGTRGPVSPTMRETLPVVLTLEVGPGWQQFTLPFDLLVQGSPRASSVAFFAGAGEAFDLWIDDLAFVCAGTCP